MPSQITSSSSVSITSSSASSMDTICSTIGQIPYSYGQAARIVTDPELTSLDPTRVAALDKLRAEDTQMYCLAIKEHFDNRFAPKLSPGGGTS